MSGLIVHEWIAPSGGSERVVDEFVSLYPDAQLQVLWNDDPGRYARKPRETWLSRTPLRRSKALALPFLPATWRMVPIPEECEWALVSSHLFAHHIRTRDIPKFVYAHTPARYIWEPELDERGNSLPARLASSVLKPIDRKRAKEAVSIAANSEFTRERIRRTWERDAIVIYPPVDTDEIMSGGPWIDRVEGAEAAVLEQLPSEFLLGASRFVPYKRLDLVIEAGEATGLPVVLAGGGPLEQELKRRAAEAGTSVVFVDRPSNELLRALYERCVAFVFPAIEDFGIMPIEAMAAGAPVIAPPQGGAAESVALTGGGVAVEGFRAEAWRESVDAARRIDRATLPGRASRFSAGRFRHEIAGWVGSEVGQRP